jgi:hypothetical protein
MIKLVRYNALTALIFSFLLILGLSACSSSSSNKPLTLEEKLKKIPDITFSRIRASEGYKEAYEIYVNQPVDHSNPGGARFSQLIFLSHIDENAPMVKFHSGYMTGRNRISEPAELLKANQIYITHRYFSSARPEPLDWRYLDIWQAASDHHRIKELFESIYKGKWVATGYSKGGMTTFYDARFYPDDVDATIAYVAPMMFGVEDPRFAAFLTEQVGTPEDREKIIAFQRLCLSNRDLLIPYYIDYAMEKDITYKFGPAATLEYNVLEYMFSFWQYGDGDTGRIPGADAGPEAWFNHLREINDPADYTSDVMDMFAPFYYQTYTQLGYTPYVYEHLSDLLVELHDPTYRVFAPADAVMVFDPGAMIDINTWLQNSGENFIYIYGGNDPYTSTAVDLTGKTNALKIVQPGANHGADIAGLDDKGPVINALEEWLDMDINVSVEQWARMEEANRILMQEERRLRFP